MKINTDKQGGVWYATFPDYYDGAPDSTGLASMYGTGMTEQEAIDDLEEMHSDFCEDRPCIECESYLIDREMNRAKEAA